MSRRAPARSGPSALKLKAASGPEQDLPEGIKPASREETFPLALAAVVASFVAFLLCYTRGYACCCTAMRSRILGMARRPSPFTQSRVYRNWVEYGCRCLTC